MPLPIYTEKKTARICKVDAPKISFRPEAVSFIEENWKRLTERRNNLFNSKLLRVLDFEDSGNELVFDVAADITYKEITGIRYAEGAGPRAVEAADAVEALSAYLFVMTSDGHLLFIQRDSGDWNKALDLPGGFIQEGFNIENIEEFARKRTQDDMSIGPEHIQSAECMGVFDFREILEIMVVYKVQLAVTLAELRVICPIGIFEVPKNYSVAAHSSHFSMPLHYACKFVLEGFIKKVYQ